MPDSLTSSTRVAILASPEKVQAQLSRQLQAAGITVVATHVPGEDFLSHLRHATPNVLLVDLGDDIDSEIPVINDLIDSNQLPILFNDSSHDHNIDDSFGIKKLVRKLTLMAHHQPSNAFIYNESDSANVDTGSDTEEPVAAQPDTSNATNVWVLGASLGGPQAVQQFLAAISPDLPVCFLLALHVGVNHLQSLKQQLQKVTPFKVIIAERGHRLRHQEIILIPADQIVNVSPQGTLILSKADPKAVYAPNIDHLIDNIIQRYNDHSGIILFSGMGNDGIKASKTVAQYGGMVWAQDSESSVVSYLPDLARKANTVSFSASPSILAEQLNRHFEQQMHAGQD